MNLGRPFFPSHGTLPPLALLPFYYSPAFSAFSPLAAFPTTAQWFSCSTMSLEYSAQALCVSL